MAIAHLGAIVPSGPCGARREARRARKSTAAKIANGGAPPSVLEQSKGFFFFDGDVVAASGVYAQVARSAESVSLGAQTTSSQSSTSAPPATSQSGSTAPQPHWQPSLAPNCATSQ